VIVDQGWRRDTPLALQIKENIRRDGPMTVQTYMSRCLWDETYGYYRRQPVLGVAGDFVTAAEISQVFGELIGVWAGVVWQGVLGARRRLDVVAPLKQDLAQSAERRGVVIDRQDSFF